MATVGTLLSFSTAFFTTNFTFSSDLLLTHVSSVWKGGTVIRKEVTGTKKIFSGDGTSLSCVCVFSLLSKLVFGDLCAVV